MNGWRSGGVEIGDVFVLDGPFEHRLGHCWARGRLKQGDVLVAIRQSGDCFHDYILLEASRGKQHGLPTLFLKPVATPFGAYVLGKPVARLGMRDLGLAMAGEDLSIPMPKGMPEPRIDPRVAALPDLVKRQAFSPSPDFANEEGETRIHDWRSHVGESVAAVWELLPYDIRLAIAADAQAQADAEEHE